MSKRKRRRMKKKKKKRILDKERNCKLNIESQGEIDKRKDEIGTEEWR